MVAVSCLPCSYAKAWSPSDLVAPLTAWQQGGTSVQVLSWLDSSGNGNNLVQLASGDQPAAATINGLDVLEFTRSEADHMDYGDIDAMDVDDGDFYTFIVVQPNSVPNHMALLAKHTGADEYLLRITSGNKVQQYIGSVSGGVVTGTTSVTIGATHIIAGYRSSGTSIVRLDGTQDGSRTNLNEISNANSVAGQGPNGNLATFDGKIGEIILGGGSISDGEILAIEGYLADRFGTVASLPATHKYKKGKPWGLGKVT